MRRQPRKPTDRSSTPPNTPAGTPGLGVRCCKAAAALVTAAMLLVGLGCAGPGTGTDRPADRPTGTDPGPRRPLAIIDDAEFRRDAIRSFREPVYAIEGRPVVLFPTPPGDLMAWWLPPTPALREPDSGRPLSARLVWLAASGSNAPRSDALAWLGGTGGIGSARWSSLPASEAARLAASTSDTERARLGDSGLWVVLVDGLRAGEAIVHEREDESSEDGASERLDLRRLAALPAGASDLSPMHPAHWSSFDRAASARLAESLGSAWRDPMQRWRVRLLADRFAGDGSFVTPLAGDGAGDPVVDEIAAQFERLWREALGTLLAHDATLAGEVFGALLPIVELSPGVPLPVWQADTGVESVLLAALLDERVTPDGIRNIVRAIRESRPAVIGWVAQDAMPIDDGFDEAIARARVAEMHGRARRATVEGGRATTPGTGVSGLGTEWFAIELGRSPDVAPRTLTLRSGALSQPLLIAPRATPVVAPRFAINALWRAWTADGFLSGQPASGVARRGERFVPTTAAILTRDAVNRRWILFVECLRDPGVTRGDEIRVWFNAATPIVVDSSGVLRDLPGMGDSVELLGYEALADRWTATLAFGDALVRGDESTQDPADTNDHEDAAEGSPNPIRFALQRTERLAIGGVRTGSWPRPKFPGQSPDTPPSTMGLDLGAWDRALAGVESFDALRRDDQRGREPFEAWRDDDPLPGPLP